MSVRNKLFSSLGKCYSMVYSFKQQTTKLIFKLFMMHEGRVIVDVSGEEKKKLTIPQLLELFEKASGSEFANDKVMLSK